MNSCRVMLLTANPFFITRFHRSAIDSRILNILVRNFFEINLKYNFIDYIYLNIFMCFHFVEKFLTNRFFSLINVYTPLSNFSLINQVSFHSVQYYCLSEYPGSLYTENSTFYYDACRDLSILLLFVMFKII